MKSLKYSYEEQELLDKTSEIISNISDDNLSNRVLSCDKDPEKVLVNGFKNIGSFNGENIYFNDFLIDYYANNIKEFYSDVLKKN